MTLAIHELVGTLIQKTIALKHEETEQISANGLETMEISSITTVEMNGAESKNLQVAQVAELEL